MPLLNYALGLTCIATAFIESSLFTKYDYAPVNISVDDTLDSEEDFPIVLQVSLHAFIECLSMFQISSSILGQQKDVQRPAFAPIRGSLRLVYEGDGQPFLIMYSPLFLRLWAKLF